MKRPWKRANLNDQIRFKITATGMRYLDEKNRSDPFYRRHPITIKRDEDGFSEMVLWDFMHVFGPSFSAPGMDPVVVPVIHIQKNG